MTRLVNQIIHNSLTERLARELTDNEKEKIKPMAKGPWYSQVSV